MPRFSTSRVLIIDHDEITLALVSYRLQKEGLLVDTASDGFAAVQKLAENEYSVVLLDILMPRLDGFGVLQYINEHRPHLRGRVIIMTIADEEARSIEGTFRAICKPIDYTVLMAAIRECLTQFALDDSASWYAPQPGHPKTTAPN